ncbi:MAG: hypothetical protein CME62_00165 [Halobacteriovoraceae bacterium]|nr:hypothetical protein [Halobacteriovoraceae bacterium]|tara:strand:+ start:3702 stop:4079 length:378 start_codon:yes stop_codon:yes gene_type:complete
MIQNQAIENKSFTFKIVEQNNICLVVFNGYLSKKSSAIAEDCLNSIKSSSCEVFIFDFQNVSFIEKTSHRFLVGLQKEIKSKEGAELKLCSLTSTFKQDLLDAGIIRNNDVFRSTKDVLLRMTMR